MLTNDIMMRVHSELFTYNAPSVHADSLSKRICCHWRVNLLTCFYIHQHFIFIYNNLYACSFSGRWDSGGEWKWGGSKPARQQASRQLGLLPPQQLPLHRRHSLPRSAFLVAPIALFLLSLADYFYVVVFSDLQRSQL